MSYTAEYHIDGFLRMHPDAGAYVATQLLNEIDEMILSWIPLRRSYEDLALVKGVSEYDILEDILRIWSVRHYSDAITSRKLDATDIDTLDLERPQWRTSGSGTGLKWYETANMTTGQLGLTSPAEQTSLTFYTSNDTFPIVLQTNLNPHGIANGAPLHASRLVRLGGSLATPLFYAKTTGYAANQLGAYVDAALTLPVGGNGTPISGVLAAPGRPKLVIECSRRTTLLGSVSMPASPTIQPLYRIGMSALYMLERRLPGARERWQEFETLLGEQADLKMKRQGRKAFSLRTFTQRPGWRSRRSRGDDHGA